jgi:hypothetical protein
MKRHAASSITVRKDHPISLWLGPFQAESAQLHGRNQLQTHNPVPLAAAPDGGAKCRASTKVHRIRSLDSFPYFNAKDFRQKALYAVHIQLQLEWHTHHDS